MARRAADLDVWQRGARALSPPNGCRRLVGLNSGPVTNRDPSFHSLTSRNLTEVSETTSTLILVVFASVLHASNEVFGERSVLCDNDDAVQVNGERTQGYPVSGTVARPRRRRLRRIILLSSSSPCLNPSVPAINFQDGVSKPQTDE